MAEIWQNFPGYSDSQCTTAVLNAYHQTCQSSGLSWIARLYRRVNGPFKSINFKYLKPLLINTKSQQEKRPQSISSFENQVAPCVQTKP